jgi:hypothetical protein
VLPPSLTFNGKPYQWTTRALPDEIRVPLFDAFKGGESVKSFISTLKDANRCAATIARLERETGAVYAQAWLDELSVTRAHPSRSFPLKSGSGFVHALGMLRFNSGARTPINCMDSFPRF